MDFSLKMNGVSTNLYLLIILLGLYDCLIGMYWLDKNHVVLDCYNKDFTCLDEEGNSRIVQDILRPISVREISTLKLKGIFRKGAKYMHRIWKINPRIRFQVLKIIHT
jgi:hypothetical protein